MEHQNDQMCQRNTPTEIYALRNHLLGCKLKWQHTPKFQMFNSLGEMSPLGSTNFCTMGNPERKMSAGPLLSYKASK